MRFVLAFFLGGGPQIRSKELVHSGADRYRLKTVAMGYIHLQIAVVLRNFEKFGVES